MSRVWKNNNSMKKKLQVWNRKLRYETKIQGVKKEPKVWKNSDRGWNAFLGNEIGFSLISSVFHTFSVFLLGPPAVVNLYFLTACSFWMFLLGPQAVVNLCVLTVCSYCCGQDSKMGSCPLTPILPIGGVFIGCKRTSILQKSSVSRTAIGASYEESKDSTSKIFSTLCAHFMKNLLKVKWWIICINCNQYKKFLWVLLKCKIFRPRIFVLHTLFTIISLI